MLTGDQRVDEGLGMLRAESEAMAVELERLEPADWERVSNCPPWTVRVLAAHVIRSAESYLLGLERGLQGITEPAMTREERTRRMHQIAEQPAAQIIADFKAIIARFEREFGGLRGEQLETLGSHTYGPRPARWFVEQRLAEAVFHRWDLHKSLGWPGVFNERAAAYLLPMLLEQNLPAMMGSEHPAGRANFTLLLKSDPTMSWNIVAAPGSLSVKRGGKGSDVEASIEGDAVSLCLLVYRRLTLKDLHESGQVRVEGSSEAAARFDELFRGP